MREYIEEWLRKFLIKITEPYQQEMVAAIMPPQQQQDYLQKRHLQASKGFKKTFHHSESSVNLFSLLVILLQSFVHIAFHFSFICETGDDT
jgi:hypothetical protein